MNLNNTFTFNLPSLDLHGYDRQTARVAIEDFIRDNIAIKKDKVLIIHGKGSGIIRKTTHETLRKNRYVDNFQIDFFNDGTTIVKLKFDK